MLVWFFSFFNKFSGAYLITFKQNFGFNFGLIIASWLIYLCATFIKFSVGMYNTWLVEHGGYEIFYSSFNLNSGEAAGISTILWYSFFSASGYSFVVFVLSLRNNISTSIEKIFRNASWLEKETGEMHDWYFSFNSDSSALFLVPMLYWAPLRNVFPTSGFFELSLNPKDGTLYPAHISWLD